MWITLLSLLFTQEEGGEHRTVSPLPFPRKERDGNKDKDSNGDTDKDRSNNSSNSNMRASLSLLTSAFNQIQVNTYNE